MTMIMLMILILTVGIGLRLSSTGQPCVPGNRHPKYLQQSITNISKMHNKCL